MEKSPEVSVYARAIRDMNTRMSRNDAKGPSAAILEDMGRLSSAMSSLDLIASDSNPEISREQRQARTMKIATRLADALPGVTDRLIKLEAAAKEGFESAFLEHSGLAHTARAAEIRAHLKTMTVAEKQAFLQDMVKAGDNETLSAAILAPPYLSGIDPERHGALKAQIEEMRLPELAANRKVFSELAGNLRTALSTAQEACRHFADPAKLRQHEAQATAVSEAEARLAGGLG